MISTTTMSVTEAAVLGVVQGLSEFLPISSTAHLRVAPAVIGAMLNQSWPDPGAAFSAVIQLGSVIAVLAYFARDIMEITKGFFASIAKKDYASRDVRLVAGIILGTIPICVVGLLMKHVLEASNGPLRDLRVIGIASIVMGLVLLFAERVGKRQKTMEDVGAQDGVLVGIGQAFAIIPGCSRSGSSLTAALLLGMTREDGARFSFLLGIPAILISGLVEIKNAIGDRVENTTPLVVALILSTVVSYAAIWWMLRFLKSHSTMVFVIYRLIFGIGVIALAAAGIIH
ncbi:MAG TPA: undecaprenyl-diphosphate phosphatase [Candidatus Obscuribacterales bacterium]